MKKHSGLKGNLISLFNGLCIGNTHIGQKRWLTTFKRDVSRHVYKTRGMFHAIYIRPSEEFWWNKFFVLNWLG